MWRCASTVGYLMRDGWCRPGPEGTNLVGCRQGWTGSQKVTGDFLKQPTPPTGPPAHTGPRACVLCAHCAHRRVPTCACAHRAHSGLIRITPHFHFKDWFKHTTTVPCIIHLHWQTEISARITHFGENCYW